MYKKFISAVALSALTLSTFAVDSQMWISAANFLWSKGIIASNLQSPDLYRLNDTITRKEMMKIVTKLAWATPDDSCLWKFQDVGKDWWCKYIERALKVWFISANKKFRPDDNITEAEAIKLIFKARGLTKSVDTGNWQNDYLASALDLGMVHDNPNSSMEAPSTDASRGWIFYASAQTFVEFKNGNGNKVMSDEAL